MRPDEKLGKLALEAKAEREQAWETIKREAPDVADFMEKARRAFGRPSEVFVEINRQVIIDTRK